MNAEKSLAQTDTEHKKAPRQEKYSNGGVISCMADGIP
jgi:hypothetical protein